MTVLLVTSLLLPALLGAGLFAASTQDVEKITY